MRRLIVPHGTGAAPALPAVVRVAARAGRASRVGTERQGARGGSHASCAIRRCGAGNGPGVARASPRARPFVLTAAMASGKYAAMRTLVVFAACAAIGTPSIASADPVLCQKTIAKQYTVLKKKTLKRIAKCLDKENLGTLPGPCPDPATDAKLAVTRQKVELKVATLCSMSDAASLGFGSSCSFGDASEDSAAEAACRVLPVTTPAELASCITCWKSADFAEFLALLYASHANVLCDGPPDLASTTCSAGGCTGAPASSPDQRDLGDTGENDCQRAIGKAGVKYLLAREKLLEKCALAGGTRQTCLNDPVLQARSDKAEDKRSARIDAKCGNRDPLPNLPFCCKTMGNQCVAAADRETCELGGGTVQEGKVCGIGNTCEPAPGGQKITWWSTCERRDCQGYGVTTLDELDGCVEDRADEIVEALLCYQFPRNAQLDWPCPSSPSGAFVE